MPPILEIDQLEKRFGGIAAVNGASFRIDSPGVLGLIGPNGAGKTTLFDLICGRQSPDAGTIRFRGRRVDGIAPFRLARLGFARSFQECRILPEATCLENLLFAAQDKRLCRELIQTTRRSTLDRAGALLDAVGLAAMRDRTAGSLSFGQRRLVEIISLLMTNPAILLLDEPAAGVNPGLLQILHDLLLDAAASGLLLLVVEHNMEFIMSLATRIVVMHQGKVLEDGTPARIQASQRVIDAYLS
jgi:ABC-type branched-subunit amino acid transport system ATPase component